jgi:hypothetical protein
MLFVDHDDEIEAFAANGADDALGEGVLPGSLRRDEDLANPQPFHPPYEHVNGVPIAEQVLWCRLFRKALDKLMAAHAAVGWSVTLTWTSSRRSWRRIKNPRSTRKVCVGTTKKSTATMSRICASGKVRHVEDGRGEGRRMYLATVSPATS